MKKAAAALVLATACNFGPSHASRPAPSRPASVAATLNPALNAQPTTQPAPQGLVITGALDVHLATAEVVQPCGPANGGLIALLHFESGGRPWSVDVFLLNYSGPGTYHFPGSRVSVHTLDVGPAPPALFVGTSGTVVVDNGERSGRLEGDFESQDQRLHVTGTWRCP